VHVIKWLVLFGLVISNTIQIFAYLRVKKVFRHLPIVKAMITRSELLNFNNASGVRVYEAKIEFTYEFHLKKYLSDTPAMRSVQLIPTWHYEQELLAKYPAGKEVDVRVLPNMPDSAYIEIAPFSFSSAVILPLITVLYIAGLVAYGWSIWIWAT